MGDIDDYDKDINDALDALENNIENITKKEFSQRGKIISKCAGQCSDIATRIESYELEILYQDRVKAIPYKESLRKIQARFAKLQKELENKKNDSASQNTLMSNEAFKNPNEMSSVELIALGNATQQKGTESLERTLNMVNQSNSLADDINTELLRQIEQLGKAQNNLKDTKSDLARANEYIKYFAKQLITDKFITCMIFLCVIALVGIIVVKYTGITVGGDDPTPKDVPQDIILKTIVYKE